MNTNQIAHIASLVGEPARTAMLMELLDGRSLTAHELAGAGNVSPQTASRHLALLVEGGLLSVEQHGRHRYHRLASPEVARVLGRLGVAIAHHLIADGAIAFDGEAGHVTDKAGAVLARLGIDLAASLPGTNTRRPYCRPCLDWSERRFHVAGQLGTLICAHCLDSGWLMRRQGMRALEITPKGVMVLRGWMGQEGWRQVIEGDEFPARTGTALRAA
jgi:DNA-binding transcriptional ArsR family regulator